MTLLLLNADHTQQSFMDTYTGGKSIKPDKEAYTPLPSSTREMYKKGLQLYL